MFSRIRVVVGLALLLSLLTTITGFAKGGFSFITITGPGLKDEVRVTDPELTTDFFAFADFFRDQAKEPADPGAGYEITRYYVDGNREYAFDHLHYYPETGFVYYDGIANDGWSEYDGKWYTAKPEMKTIFEGVLPTQVQPIAPVIQSQPNTSLESPKSNPSIFQTQPVLLTAVIAGLLAILGFAFWLRRSPAH